MMTTRRVCVGLVLLCLVAVGKATEGEPTVIDTPRAKIIVENNLDGSSESSDSASSSSSDSLSSSSLDSSSLSSSLGSSSLSSSSGSESLSSSSASGSQSGVATPPRDLIHAVEQLLPPEPAAARGYRPYPICKPTDPCANGAQPTEENQEEENVVTVPVSPLAPAGCVENCTPLEDKDTQVPGPTFLSHPTGVGAALSGYVPVPNTQTLAGGASFQYPAPLHSLYAGAVPLGQPLSDSPVGAPLYSYVNDATASTISLPPIPSQEVPAGLVSIGGGACPGKNCPQYVGPLEAHARRQAAFENKLKAEREHERATLSEELMKHRQNLAQVEKMARALQYQYSDLRRQHLSLRAQLSANKLKMEQLGGFDSYKGTEFDIEGPAPPSVEDIDDIDAIPLDNEWGKQVQRLLDSQFVRNMQLMSKTQKGNRNALRDFYGVEKIPQDTDSASSSSGSESSSASQSRFKQQPKREPAKQLLLKLAELLAKNAKKH